MSPAPLPHAPLATPATASIPLVVKICAQILAGRT
jgi:hypothetical protein